MKSSISSDAGGTTFAGPEAVNLMACLAVKHAIQLYLNTGIKANHAYTSTKMRAYVSRVTGKKYSAGRNGLTAALKDISDWIEVRKREIALSR